MFYTFVVFFSITYLIEHDRTAHHVALHELDQVWNNHSKVQVMGSGELGLVNPGIRCVLIVILNVVYVYVSVSCIGVGEHEGFNVGKGE